MIRGDSYSVLSNGAVSRVNDVKQVEDKSFPAYFTQVSCAALTHSLLLNPTRLLIGGTQNAKWQMISVEMPSLATGLVQELSILVNIPECANLFCQNVGQIITDGTFVIFAMQTNTGVGLARFRYTQLGDTSVGVEYSVIRDSVPTGSVVNITAIILDPVSHAGFLAVNAAGEPTTLFKFDMITLEVYGNVRFQRVGAIYEIVTSLSRDDATRTLYASIPLEYQHSIIPLNLYAVTRVFPPIADTAGGTMITIEGEGFTSDHPLCDFNGTLVPAEFINSRELQCKAPTGGNERCTGNPLEVSIGKERYSKNKVPLRRATSPRITRCYTQDFMGTDQVDAYGEIQGGRSVMVVGVGFENTPLIACRIKSIDSIDDAQYAFYADTEYAYFDGKQGIFYGNAQFISSSLMRCTQPRFPYPTLRNGAHIEVTFDGTVYSRSNSLYEVVGPAVSLQVFLNTTVESRGDSNHHVTWRYGPYREFELNSADEVAIPEVFVGVVDAEGHRLRKLDMDSRSISVRLLAYSPVHFYLSQDEASRGVSLPGVTGVCDNSAPAFPMPILYGGHARHTVEGMAYFHGAFMHRPPSGGYTLRYTALLTGWVYDLNFTIRTGTPHALRMCQEPGIYIDNNIPTLAIQPVLFFVDSSQNQIPTVALNNEKGYQVIATYVSEKTTSLVQGDPSKDGRTTHGIPKQIIHKRYNQTKVSAMIDNFFRFSGIEMSGLHGHTYTISFHAVETSANGTASRLTRIPTLHSRPLPVKACPNNLPFQDTSVNPPPLYFAKKGTSECYLCPSEGLCDGTSKISIKSDNWWRPSEDSLQYYSCASPVSGDSCLAENGTCKKGYQGPRCSVCTEGYGKEGSFCVPCQPKETLGAMFGLSLLIGFAFCALLMGVTMNAPRRDSLGPVLKLFLSHLYVSSCIGKLGRPYSPVLTLLFNIQKHMSTVVRLDLSGMECPPLYLSSYHSFFLLVSIPFLLILLFVVGFFLFKLGRRLVRRQVGVQQQQGTAEAYRVGSGEEEEDTEHAQSSGGGVSCDNPIAFFAATVVIVLFLAAPCVLLESMDMLSCDTIAVGDGNTFETVSYFTRDRSIRCTEPTHRAVSLFASLFTLLYTLGVPMAALGLVAYYWKKTKWQATRKVFSFFLAGYARPMWWWEVVVLARKVLIVSCVALIGDKSVQVYCAMWAMTIALTVHIFFQPFCAKDVPKLYALEGVSLTLISITLNMVLLFQFPAFQETNENPLGFWALSLSLLTLHLLMMLLFGYFVLHAIVQRWKASRKGDPEEEIENDDALADDFDIPGLSAAITHARNPPHPLLETTVVVSTVTPESLRKKAQENAEAAAEKERRLEALLRELTDETHDLNACCDDLFAITKNIKSDRLAVEAETARLEEEIQIIQIYVQDLKESIAKSEERMREKEEMQDENQRVMMRMEMDETNQE